MFSTRYTRGFVLKIYGASYNIQGSFRVSIILIREKIDIVVRLQE